MARRRKSSTPDLINYDLGEFEHLRSKIDIMNVTLKLLDEHAYVVYKPMNEPELIVERFSSRAGDVGWVYDLPRPSKRPWRLFKTFGGMGSYSDFEALERAYQRIIDRAQDGR